MRYSLALFLVVSTLFSPYSLLGGAVAFTAWFALGRICGKERAIIVIWTGTLLFWVLYIVSQALYPQPERAVTTAGFPFPMRWTSTNALDTTLSKILRENTLAYFANYALALTVMLFVSKPLERTFMPAGKPRPGVWFAIVALTFGASLLGNLVFAVSIN